MTTLVAEANRSEEADHVMVILDQSGDTRHTWDRTSTEEIAAMREIFDLMKEKGYVAWSVTRSGKKDKKIREFDPDAEKIIFAPALVGG